jgi:hypothetical protein
MRTEAASPGPEIGVGVALGTGTGVSVGIAVSLGATLGVSETGVLLGGIAVGVFSGGFAVGVSGIGVAVGVSLGGIAVGVALGGAAVASPAIVVAGAVGSAALSKLQAPRPISSAKDNTQIGTHFERMLSLLLSVLDLWYCMMGDCAVPIITFGGY